LWDAARVAASPLFWPVARAARALVAAMGEAATKEAFPQPELIDAALGPEARVRFERQRPVSRRRRRAARAPESLYDARISREGCVPTRPGSWHDLMNALVWATFPAAKRALHERQHGLVVPAAPGESARRPRELDALALLDEGGILVVARAGEPVPLDEDAVVGAVARGEAAALVFGHAIYEGLVLGRAPPLASVVCLAGDAAAPSVAGAAHEPHEDQGARDPILRWADQALAGVVRDRARLLDPKQMLRVRADPGLLTRPSGAA
jgi:hypothetical protein